jgi:hypothetical protein
MKEQDEHMALVHISRTQLISEFYLVYQDKGVQKMQYISNTKMKKKTIAILHNNYGLVLMFNIPNLNLQFAIQEHCIQFYS